LEEDGGVYHPEERLEEVGDIPVGELEESKMLEEDGTAELKSATEWQLNAIIGSKYSMGDRVDLPTDKEEEVQQRGLHKKSQPLD
jgi:hypothetical protein